MKKVVVVTGFSKLTVPQKVESARVKATSMTGNANFPTPNPPLATITTGANALETAGIAAAGGGVDETAVMRAKEALLELSIKLLAAYVENVANANPANAEAIVLSAGMDIKRSGPARANGFRVAQGKNSGSADLRTNFDPRATFTYQVTTTPGDEASWEEVHSSTHAHFTVTGLTPGTRYYFRVAKTDKDGQGPWSNVLSIIVV